MDDTKASRIPDRQVVGQLMNHSNTSQVADRQVVGQLMDRSNASQVADRQEVDQLMDVTQFAGASKIVDRNLMSQLDLPEDSEIVDRKMVS